MESIGSIGKLLMLIGGIFLVIGAVLIFLGRIPGAWKLPGDIMIKRGNFTFFFPITTSIIISIILSLFFALLSRK